MSLFCGTMMAQTTVWEETWSGWSENIKTNPEGVNPNYSFKGTVLNDDGTYKSGTGVYDEKLAGGDAPELMVAKSGGSFTANIKMDGKSGDFTLSFKANNNNLEVTATNASLGEVSATGNDYSYPVTVASGTSEISITFKTTSSKNTRLDNIKLYQGDAKKPAGLSWGTASRTVTIGSEDNVFPTLTNANELPITYTSSETNVATINENGVITLVSEGKTNITATFAGNDEYEAGEVSYELTVKAAQTGPEAPTISGTTPFKESTEVTISVPDGGSTKYTTDGSDPNNGTVYSSPFTITETTTVKAVSYDEDGNASKVTTKTFTKEEAPAVETVTLPYEDTKLEKFTKNNVKLPSELTYIWSFDSRYSCMKASAYKGGALESESWLESPIIDLTAATNPVLAFEHAINQFSSVDKAKEEATVWIKEETGEWKQLEGVAYPEKLSWTFISSGDISLNEYKGKKIQIGFKYMSTAEKAGTWEVKEFKVTDGAPVITYTDKTIAEINEMSEDASNINLKLTNAQVVYVDGNIQYVREGDKAVMFYNLGIDLPVNSILNGEIKVDYDNYYGLHEVKAISDVTNVDGLTITDGEAATPTATTVAELIELKHIADYVIISGVKIVSEEKNYFAVDGDSKIQLFKGIDVSSYADNDKTYDIKALFNNIYKGTAEIQPVEVTEAGGETPATPEMIAFTDGDTAGDGAVFSKGDFKLTQVDTDGKTAIDGNNVYFGTADNYQKFTHRLKTGGKSGSKNSLTLTIPSDGTLNVYVRTGSNTATDRNLVLTQDGTELYNQVVQEADAITVTMGENDNKVYPVITVNVKAGEVAVGYPTGSLNFYGFEFIAGASGVNAVIVEKAKNNIRYNLAGQRVDESYKGVVIMNGKKFVVK
jgi:hypothetical protein